MKRKIAAILAADVVGYSRLMAEDEEETTRRLVSYRSVFDDFVTRADGRIFNTAGDAVLAEFPSAVDALRAAIDIQESLRTRNLSYPPSRHMVFRIGLTIGDVIQREGDLLGDGVNVAARLQALAAPGGICVSRSVHEQVADKLSVVFSDLGPQDVKNIPRPVHAYQVHLERGPERASTDKGAIAQTIALNRRPSALLFVTVALAIALGALASFLVQSELWSRRDTHQKEVAVATPTPAASDPKGIEPLAATKPLVPATPNAVTVQTMPDVPRAPKESVTQGPPEEPGSKEWASIDKTSVTALETFVREFGGTYYSVMALNDLDELKRSQSNRLPKVNAPGTSFAEGLTSLLEKLASPEPPRSRSNSVAAFTALPNHRAMALAPKAKAHWRTGSWPSRQVAEEKVLEKCAQFYDEPCAIIASDDVLAAPNADGTWSTRDAPKARFAGSFDPEKVPGLRESQLRTPEILGYANSAGPKAAAFHAQGIFTVAVGATSQREAEEKALSACNGNDRAASGGSSCYLYAVGNRVVLPLRLTSPLTAEVQNTQSAAPSAATPTPAPFQPALLAAMGEIVPAMPENIRSREAFAYVIAGTHKALAMHPPYDSWRRSQQSTEKIAEQIALEACEVRYGDPCILLAVNDNLKQRAEWQKRSMPRVSYGGTFDPQQIPTVADSTRTRTDVANYSAVVGPKATALHPYGLIFVVTGGESQFSTEVKALSDCNDDPARNGRDGPCWLYSIGNQVVLSKRSRFPVSPKG